jgi:3-oxoacyl-[acyl-carrier protein] reductase
MLLADKNAVIYGAGGAVGRVVAHTFAREGAKVFLAGRTLEPLDAVAREIRTAGGIAEIAQVDALDGQSIEQHLDDIVRQAEHIDVSFNLIGWQDIQGKSLIDMTYDEFSLPITIGMQTQFLTTTAAARHMTRQGSGVILALSATAALGAAPHVGGFGAACAAMENLCKQLATELGPHGVRVVCLRSSGSPETPGLKAVFETHAGNNNMTLEEFETMAASGIALRRFPRLAEVARAAALMASDHASAMTATIADVTCGVITG